MRTAISSGGRFTVTLIKSNRTRSRSCHPCRFVNVHPAPSPTAHSHAMIRAVGRTHSHVAVTPIPLSDVSISSYTSISAHFTAIISRISHPVSIISIPTDYSATDKVHFFRTASTPPPSHSSTAISLPRSISVPMPTCIVIIAQPMMSPLLRISSRWMIVPSHVTPSYIPVVFSTVSMTPLPISLSIHLVTISTVSPPVSTASSPDVISITVGRRATITSSIVSFSSSSASYIPKITVSVPVMRRGATAAAASISVRTVIDSPISSSAARGAISVDIAVAVSITVGNATTSIMRGVGATDTTPSPATTTDARAAATAADDADARTVTSCHPCWEGVAATATSSPAKR
mmetsp:Transcript_7890/g.14866  ORF Transcript_7890/g.14866 Transcript_7890/m.14866 type:complete len:347 (+) Transcript_7890:565-1605(+)